MKTWCRRVRYWRNFCPYLVGPVKFSNGWLWVSNVDHWREAGARLCSLKEFGRKILSTSCLPPLFSWQRRVRLDHWQRWCLECNVLGVNLQENKERKWGTTYRKNTRLILNVKSATSRPSIRLLGDATCWTRIRNHVRDVTMLPSPRATWMLTSRLSMAFSQVQWDSWWQAVTLVEEQIPDEEVNSVDLVKKRKTKIEYLMDERQVKSSSKTQKEVNRSFKDLFLTQKKNVSNLQWVHGAAPEFVLIVKNNVQKPGGKNAAATAGKYMVASRGNLREMMFSTGIKFTEDFVMMANDYDMQIDKYPDKNVKS